MSEEKKPPLKLYKKLHAIMSGIERIEKDSRNDNSNYNYASEKIIKEVFHKALSDVGVLFKLDAISSKAQETIGKSGAGLITVVNFRYSFIDIDSGESLSGSFLGSGNGRDDKGPYAAVTGAIKYIFTSTFLMPTGDDPEADGAPPLPRVTKPANEPTKKPEATAPKTEPPAKNRQYGKSVCEDCGEMVSDHPGVRAKHKKKCKGKTEKPAPQPEPEPVEPKVSYGFGEPQEGEPKISEAKVGEIIKGFGKYGVTEADLVKVSGLNIADWTPSIKAVALNNFVEIKNGNMTRDEFIS